ncbi:hypothetical protein ACOL3H_07120 [Aliarcobacter butzleri]
MQKQKDKVNLKQYIVFSLITLISGIVFYYGIYLYTNDKKINEFVRTIWGVSIVIHPICWFVLIKRNCLVKEENTNSSSKK